MSFSSPSLNPHFSLNICDNTVHLSVAPLVGRSKHSVSTLCRYALTHQIISVSLMVSYEIYVVS